MNLKLIAITFISLFILSFCDGTKPPNIVFIMSDDHGSDAISAYGSKIIDTPNIDRIANNGIRFTNTFVTTSLCAPSRAAILTSKYGAKNGFKRNGDVFDGSQQTFPKLLQEGGYKTALFGKWHLGSQPTGFDYYEVVRGQGRYFNPKLYKTGMEWNDDWKPGPINDRGMETPGFFGDIIFNHSVEWLNNIEGGQPFALFVHDKSPHSPHITPDKYDAYFTEDFSEPVTFDSNFERKNSFLNERDIPDSKLKNAWPYAVVNSRYDVEKILQGEYTPPFERGTESYKRWAYQTLLKGYYRQVKNLDDNIGHLLDYLEEKGLDENTIIVYTSDNGWFLGDHGLYNKMWVYEESLRIPFVISYGSHFSNNRVEDSIVSALDFGPTFLDYAGLDIPSGMQGRSLKPILEGEAPNNWRSSFYYRYYEQFDIPDQFGIRTHNFKLIEFADSVRSESEYELYDLNKDPREENNVFNKSQYAQVQDSLLNKLDKLKLEYDN